MGPSTLGASDTNNGQFKTSQGGANGPFLTFDHALSVAAAALGGTGKTIGVRGSTYNQQITGAANGNSTTDRVLIRKYGQESVWVIPGSFGAGGGAVYFTNNSYLDFDGINVSSSLATDTASTPYTVSVNYSSTSVFAHHIRWRNAELRGSTIDGDLNSGGMVIQVAANSTGGGGFNQFSSLIVRNAGGANAHYGAYIHGSDNEIDHCDISDVGFLGIQLYNGAGPIPKRNVLHHNKIHDITKGFTNQRRGITCYATDSLIYNNLIYGLYSTASPGSVIPLNHGQGSSNKFYYLTIADNHGSAIQLGDSSPDSVDHATLENLIVYGNDGDGITHAGDTQTTLITNLFGQDPAFFSTNQRDYHLTASSTRAIGQATAISTVTTDLDDVSRPQGSSNDIGCYEFV